jgi:nitrite reductase/ring-hydroxylating ferredoxin subunit
VRSLSRRTFIKLTGTTLICTCAGALGAGACRGKPASDTPALPAGSYRVANGRLMVDLAAVGALLDVGGAAKVSVADSRGTEPSVIIVRPGETDYRAFANACTHNGKELNYLHEEGLLACCGRSSRFDLAGAIVHGPAEQALPCYDVLREGVELYVEL